MISAHYVTHDDYELQIIKNLTPYILCLLLLFDQITSDFIFIFGCTDMEGGNN